MNESATDAMKEFLNSLPDTGPYIAPRVVTLGGGTVGIYVYPRHIALVPGFQPMPLGPVEEMMAPTEEQWAQRVVLALQNDEGAQVLKDCIDIALSLPHDEMTVTFEVRVTDLDKEGE